MMAFANVDVLLKNTIWINILILQNMNVKSSEEKFLKLLIIIVTNQDKWRKNIKKKLFTYQFPKTIYKKTVIVKTNSNLFYK